MRPLKNVPSAVWIFIVAATAVVGLCFTYAVIDLPGDPAENEGTFGDRYGALNSMFAGLAFAGLIATLWHQFSESRKRDAEMLAFKETLARTADALEHQAKTNEAGQYLTALQARIDGYNAQIAKWDQKNLVDEREQLLWELAAVLERARTVVGGQAVSKDQVQEEMKTRGNRLAMNRIFNRSR